jgi:hypothetical protein
MPDRLLHLVRTLLALALLGVGPATRVADALLYHSSDVPATMARQIDDGSTLLPHGDVCLLAVASAPATPTMADCPTLVVASTTIAPELPPTGAPVGHRATGPPPSRAPPA